MDINLDIDEELPLELMEHAKAAQFETLPVKSREQYSRVYNNFKSWQKSYGVNAISCNLMLAYFGILSEKYKPTSMWAFHSMLKSTLRAHENVDIRPYYQVTAFLKAKSAGYKVVKAMVFEEEHIRKFINEADDLTWLDVKVVLIFDICGACRTDELTRITVNDVEKHGGLFLVKLLQTKTKVSGSFTINGGFVSTVAKYLALRSSRLTPNDRFFTNYQRGKCTIQFIGKHKFSMMPRRIAEYLSLPDIHRYTGHAFRRTSATILANNGADLEAIMRHGRWRNGACAKGYIEDSLKYKERTGSIFQQSLLGIGNSPSAAIPFINAPVPRNAVSSTVPSVAPVISSIASAARTATSSISVVDVDTMFDDCIDNAALIDIIDRASQAHDRSIVPSVAPVISSIASAAQTATSSISVVDVDTMFDDCIDNAALIDIIDRASQAHDHERSIVRENDGQSSANLTQSNNYSNQNAVLARAFKSLSFDHLTNCTFNFYLGKTEQ